MILSSTSCIKVLKAQDSQSREGSKQQRISMRAQNLNTRFGSTVLKVAMQKFQSGLLRNILSLQIDLTLYVSTTMLKSQLALGLAQWRALLSASHMRSIKLLTQVSVEAKERKLRTMQRLPAQRGLGTVIAEFAGGFEMRTSVGAPGIGSVSKINLDKNYRAVVLCLAPILTRSFLTNRINEINGLGGIMLTKLSASKSVDDFLKMSRRFAEMLGLAEGRCKRPIAALKARGIESSVALFGQTVFTVISQARAEEAGCCPPRIWWHAYCL